MNPENPNANDEHLRALLREARATPSLPPRFQEGVWRRIEEYEAPAAVERGWMAALAMWVLRPKFALATAVVLVFAGSIIGVRQGHQEARQDAQTRYIVSVAPNSLR